MIIASELLDFRQKKVVVVGGSSGIGNAIAQAFRRPGAEVHVWGTRAGPEDYDNEVGSDLADLNYAQVDVSNTEVIKSAPPDLGTLDVLILSRGIVLYNRQEFEDSGFRQVIEVNLNSLMACCTRFFEPLKTARGVVIVVNSTAAFHATRGNPAYNASKAGALGLARTLAAAWAPLGIRVNGLAPGMVETKMTRVTTEHPKRRQSFLEKIPLGRLGRPGDIAGPALFLASPMADYITGQTLPVDGGLTLS